MSERSVGSRPGRGETADARGSAARPETTDRYEAIIAFGDTVCWRPDTVGALAALCASGVSAAIIGTHRASDMAEQIAGFDPGAGALFLAAVPDPWCVIIEGSGTWVVQRDVSGFDDPPPILSGVEDATLQWVTGELWKRGIGLRDALVVFDDDLRTGHPDRVVVAPAGDVTVASVPLDDVIAHQWELRERGEFPRVLPSSGWDVTTEDFEVGRVRVNGSLFALADGMVGTSGAPLASYPGLYRWVAAGSLYIDGGAAARLITAPVAMQLPYELSEPPHLRLILDLHSGVLHEEASTSSGPLSGVRFASLARPGTVVFRARCPDARDMPAALLPPADDAVLDDGLEADASWCRVAASAGGVVAAAIDRRTTAAGADVIDRVAVYRASADDLPAPEAVLPAVRNAATAGFEGLLAEHRVAWAARWEEADVAIDGDDDLQRAIRFALFHLMGSVPNQGEAAVGARGLTGPGYRGHVFWDADTFVLPFLAATHPRAARAMLEYRIRRLPAARATARAFGRNGARFPWESAHSGRDVTPSSARDRTGKLVPIRTGQLEEHIVAQVAWAACCYADWTGDDDFARGAGLDLLVETARYWASRVRREGGRAHIYGVIGPDEYHEPVDDNAFTNVMAQWNLRRAAAAVLTASPTEMMVAEAVRWRTTADELVDGYDADTGIYEQCAGFYDLEPLIIAEVAPRRPIAADLLLGADRVRQSQVIKQADVLMLHHLVPDAVEPDTLEPNLRFYEPRTAHGSSLSPGVHASLFARTREYDRALEALRIAARLDLDDLTGTTGSGLHLATMGGVWQALAYGFFGLRPRDGVLGVDPRLPPVWGSMQIRVRFHGTPLRIRIERNRLRVDGDGHARLSIGGVDHVLDSGPLNLQRRGHSWKVAT